LHYYAFHSEIAHFTHTFAKTGGDASMTELEANQSEESLLAHMEGLKRKASDQQIEQIPLLAYTYRNKRQRLNDGNEQSADVEESTAITIRRGRVGYQEFGILRTKPGTTQI
jgi:hypothetical protein